MTDWFQTLFGFAERSAAEVRRQIICDGDELRSLANETTYRCGTLEIPSLHELRQHGRSQAPVAGSLQFTEWVGDVRSLLTNPASAGATFQVASQFNLLEMVGPHVSPDQGVTIYEHDPTQGPACAIACGAGTVYRNYFIDLPGGQGQTTVRQVNCLADFGAAVDNPSQRYWRMQNGYLLTTAESLHRLAQHLNSLNAAQLDELRGTLRIGVHRHTQVTIDRCQHTVTQVYASAIPVSYHRFESPDFEPLARLVLEAAYEATLLVTLNDAQARQRPLYLTLLGGGAFGNQASWILDAIERAIGLFRHHDLSISVVSYGKSNPQVQRLIRKLSGTS